MSESKNHCLIEKRSEPSMYEDMAQLVRAYHLPQLAEARIALVWRYGWKRNKDGLLVLGKCKKASDYDKSFADYDFVILLNYEAWTTMSKEQQAALLDHELCHATGSPHKKTGEMRYRIRKHDLEEFRDVVRRHGCYKADIEEFVNEAMGKEKPKLFEEPGEEKPKQPIPIPAETMKSAARNSSKRPKKKK